MNEAPHARSDLLQRIVDRVPSMLAYWDRELRCQFANDAYQRWFGVDPERPPGMSLRGLLGAELFAASAPHITRALLGTEQTFERHAPEAGGSGRLHRSTYVPDLVDGRVAGLVEIVTEVVAAQRTEAAQPRLVAEHEAEGRRRRALEEHLADSREHLAIALASIGAGFIASDRLGRVIQMNAVAQKLTGWTLAEAQGRRLWDVFQREDRPPALDSRRPVDMMLEHGFASGVAHHLVAVSRSGVTTPVEVRAARTHGADGSERGMAIIVRDRSRQIESEIDSNRLAAIVESSQDAIISKRLDGTVLTWNAAAEQLFGYRAEEMIGRSVLMLIPDDRQGEEMRILAELARGVRVKAFDTQRRTKDGRLIDVSLTISPIRDTDGRIIGASKILRDISDRQHAEQARARAERLQAENRQIHEATRLKSQFLASVSHELRTPLNAIIGFAELLQSGFVAADAEKTQRFVGHIATSGRHLLQLINDVLDLAKVESGRFEFQPEPLDPARVVQEVHDVVRAAADRKRITLSAEVDPGLTGIVLDPVRLKQVLYNYLSNAIKFTAEGGRVMIRVAPEGADRFRIDVADTGIGIAPEEMRKLFREFQQLDAGYSKTHQGTGLGLALTKRLVEAQGGSVGVTSVVGQGSSFFVVLPREHRADPVRRMAGGDAEDGAGLARGRLLVAEQNRDVRLRIMNGLAGAGFEVSAAATGEQVRLLAQQSGFDALTLDLRLPDHGGLGVLAKLRHEAPALRTPVVGLTAPGGPGLTASFAISDILCKPIRSDEVAAAMARLDPSRGERTRVMVIDDDPMALDLMRATLAGMGITCACFERGRDALHAVERARPQAIILDLMMPELDGFTVLDALRRMPDVRETPVFIWTSMTLTDAEYDQLARSAHAIVSKGGAGLVDMLERLRRWRPAPTLPQTERG